jgi:hypothetical protein
VINSYPNDKFLEEAAESLKCSDLHTLLSLAKNSLREVHPTFAFCVQASKMARTLNGKKKKPDGDDDGGYLVMLKGTKESYFVILLK